MKKAEVTLRPPFTADGNKVLLAYDTEKAQLRQGGPLPQTYNNFLICEKAAPRKSSLRLSAAAYDGALNWNNASGPRLHP